MRKLSQNTNLLRYEKKHIALINTEISLISISKSGESQHDALYRPEHIETHKAIQGYKYEKKIQKEDSDGGLNEITTQFCKILRRFLPTDRKEELKLFEIEIDLVRYTIEDISFPNPAEIQFQLEEKQYTSKIDTKLPSESGSYFD